ncbi:LysR family transcriptional regulator [Thalassorhabdomicrobium marinisediminis]|uniref:LysR family transcriptional regulator n=1 Tax=Thalassorhabdomicrobium marinisediminis TaxID=2170577 RepID=UPI001304CC08|nr:LysR family transcriptional regulator [Thalassorhabdomicrobium marinisediminis]
MRIAYRYFAQAVRDGSIRRASENLNIASSAVNRQLLLLEEEFGAPLFLRLPRGIKPTPEGSLVLEYIRRWQDQDRVLEEEIAALRGGVRGTIRIAAAESITETILPQAMSEFREQYPKVDFTLISGDNFFLTSELTSKEAEVVIAFDVQDRLRASFVHEITSPLGIICSPNHPLAAKKEVSLADCSFYPMIIPGDAWLQNSGLSGIMSDAIRDEQIAVRAERPGMLKAMVASGIGVAMLTYLGVEREIDEGRLSWVPLVSGIIRPAVISVLVPKDWTPATSSRVFLDILIRELSAARVGPT